MLSEIFSEQGIVKYIENYKRERSGEEIFNELLSKITTAVLDFNYDDFMIGDSAAFISFEEGDYIYFSIGCNVISNLESGAEYSEHRTNLNYRSVLIYILKKWIEYCEERTYYVNEELMDSLYYYFDEDLELFDEEMTNLEEYVIKQKI